jgi:vacuolar-type H+-ATPase subunit I/STV1
MEVSPLKGLDEFLTLFGSVTLADLVVIILACVFLYSVYKKVKDYFIKKHDIEIQKEADLKEALTAARKYPEYRQQSIKIQELLESEIQELRAMIQEDKERLARMEERDERRERNKLRDMLLQNYRYYTNKEQNPSQSWSKMEAEAFWELFRDYEDLGGNGYMHTEVLPEMERLVVVDFRK